MSPSCGCALSSVPLAVSPWCRPQLQRDAEEKGPTIPTDRGHAGGHCLLQTSPLGCLGFLMFAAWLSCPLPAPSCHQGSSPPNVSHPPCPAGGERQVRQRGGGSRRDFRAESRSFLATKGCTVVQPAGGDLGQTCVQILAPEIPSGPGQVPLSFSGRTYQMRAVIVLTTASQACGEGSVKQPT